VYTDTQIMFTLAGLTYRGFQDVLPGEPHEYIVRRALLDGLQTLGPVRGDWELVWGPVTSRIPLGVFDSSAMYVVRNVHLPHRYVVATRGTNPLSSSDWLFGDLWVGTTVRWPFGTDSAAISTSTALGLASLQDMRWHAPSLYGIRSAIFAALLPGIIADQRELDYRQIQTGITAFAGALDPARPFAAEFIHQHMDAYIMELGLFSEMNAITFFI
jgi:hypothetical protein